MKQLGKKYFLLNGTIQEVFFFLWLAPGDYSQIYFISSKYAGIEVKVSQQPDKFYSNLYFYLKIDYIWMFNDNYINVNYR